MPLKKDETGKRWVEMEIVVPGTPEQVWDAIATGPGTTAWFTPTRIDTQPGGAIEFDLGAHGTSTGEVTDWDPPRRFAYVERDWGENAPPLATEIIVIGRAGGTCVIRMVHSLFAETGDWDDQIEGFEGGWPGFFEVLKLYLEHFAGKTAACFPVRASTAMPHATLWARLVGALGLGAANVGEEWTIASDPGPLTSIVERVQQARSERYALLRLTAPGPGLLLIGTYEAGEKTIANMVL